MRLRSRTIVRSRRIPLRQVTPQRPPNFTGLHSPLSRTSQVLLLNVWALAGLEENHQPQTDLLLRAKERKRDKTSLFTGN